MLEPHFTRIIVQEHDLLSIETHRRKFLDYLPEGVRNKVDAAWKSDADMSGEKRWQIWCEEYDKFMSQGKKQGAYNKDS